ncbi:MAG: NAD(P)H-hydrate dehydratase [Flavobacteriales bacterium]|nr:NAD(P)H-hydrate dehydratase [Flavobacteriales bacterium]
MLPVLGPSTIRHADAWTIEHEPISSLELMERASRRCAARIVQILDGERCFGDPFETTFLVLAGMGNNGGDGLAIARMLHEVGMSVRVVRVRHKPEASSENATNWERAIASGVAAIDLSAGEQLPRIGPHDVIIDALYGTGLRTAIEGWVASLIEAVNTSGAMVVAIDMPSGLLAEPEEGTDRGAVIRANRTITFEVPKLAFFFAENAANVGQWEVLPIGLDAQFIAKQPTDHHLLGDQDVRSLLGSRPRFAHKGTFGHSLLIAGSSGKMGAAVLATRSALRSGTGLVTARVPQEERTILQTTAPEAMCSVDRDAGDGIGSLPDLASFTAVGIGPGMGVTADTVLILKNLIQSVRMPCVIDADALNILAENPTWLSFLPQGTILTPHPKEFDRLVGVLSNSGHERLQRARELAIRSRCHLVLKGAWTAICEPTGHVYFNPTGNPGMAKGGSGDALTGLIIGLLAQGYAPKEACVLGVYLHGLAGDLAAKRIGMDGMTAGDLVDAIPAAWRRLRSGSEQVRG